MGKPSDHLRKFMETHHVASDEVWEVRAGGAWAIKHSALERVAAEAGITFDPPMISEKDSANKIVAMLVTARMGDRVEWSFGEASPRIIKTHTFMRWPRNAEKTGAFSSC